MPVTYSARECDQVKAKGLSDAVSAKAMQANISISGLLGLITAVQNIISIGGPLLSETINKIIDILYPPTATPPTA